MLCAVNWDSPVMCKALWSYEAQMPCDLTFAAGKNGMYWLYCGCSVLCGAVVP